MAVVQYAAPRTSQPQDGAVVDWTNPLTRGLVDVIDLSGYPRSLVLGTPATIVGSGAKLGTPTSHGLGYDNRGVACGVAFRRNDSAYITPSTTHVMVGALDELGSAGGYVVSTADTVTFGSYGLYYESGYLIGSSGFYDAPGVMGGGVGVLVGYCGPTANGLVWNGKVLGTGGGMVLDQYPTSTLNLRMARNGDAASGLRGRSLLHAVYNRVLSAEEITSLTANPWQLFAPSYRSVYFGAATGSDFSGGSSSIVDVFVSGAGRASISTGSAAAVTNATAVGAGSLAIGSGSQSTVTVTAVGSGFSSSNPAYAGGSGSNVVVSSVGAGRVAFSLGSSSSVLVSAFGAGYANPFGGAGSTVIVTAVGAGTKFEFGNPTGGSSSVVSITAQGAGVVAIYGGGSVVVNVTAQGTGTGFMQVIGQRIKTAYKRITEASVIVYPVRTRRGGWWFPKR